MHATWRCSIRSSSCVARGKVAVSSAASTRPTLPAFGIRHGQRPTAPLKVNHRRRADEVLAKASERHNAALHAITERSGGALFHGTILDPKAPGGGRALGKIEPGDFVEVQAHQTVRGIALPIIHDGVRISDERRSAILLPTGELKFLSLEDTVITFPRFIDERLTKFATVNLLTPPTMTEGEKIRVKLDDLHIVMDFKALSARAEICAVLRSLLRQSEQQQWRLTRPFEERYLALPVEDLTIEQRLITVPEMARQLLSDSGMSDEQAKQGSRSPATLLAVQGLLIGAPDIFHMDPINHRSTLTFLMQSASEQKAWKAVEGMVQEALEVQTQRLAEGSSSPASSVHEDPIASFARRVKTAVKERKQVYEKLGSTNGPPVVIAEEDAKATAVRWTEDDKVIITFLRSALGVRRTYKSESTAQVQNYILRRCGYEIEMSTDTIDTTPGPALETISSRKASIARMFREVGLLTPWERLLSFENEFEERIEQPYARAPDELAWKDDEYMRREFAETTYVIDDGHAMELDDGLSIERTSTADQVWLHVHIADPTAALDPNDAIAIAAKQRHSSVYLADRAYSMLPRAFAAPIGLQARVDGDGSPLQRAMTFSAKVNVKSGIVTDFNVGLSFLRRIRVMTYEDATAIMLKGARGDDDGMTSDLQLLRDVTGALDRRRRLQCGAFHFSGTSIDVEVLPDVLPASSLRQYPSPPSFDTPMYGGFPTINVQQSGEQQSGGPLIAGARGAVAEAAMTACMVAAKWAEEHNVPTIYRGQTNGGSPEALSKFLAQRDEHGIVDFAAVAKAQVVAEGATLSSQPLEHFALGVRTALGLSHLQRGSDDVLLSAGYARTTSPLRRFPDMLAHWQLRHALELQHPKHAPAASSARYPWSLDDLLTLIPRVGRMESWHKSFNRGHASWWLLLKLHRTMLARRLAGLPGGGTARIGGVIDNDGLTALDDSLNDVQAQQILNGVHAASITVGDIRRLPNGENRVLVLLRSLNLSAQLMWPANNAPDWYIPRIGETISVRIVDIAWAGNTSTTTVQRVYE